MEPRQSLDFNRPFVSEWQWSYNQPTITLRGQTEFLARLMIAEVTNMDMLQAIMLRWGENISMREHVECTLCLLMTIFPSEPDFES